MENIKCSLGRKGNIKTTVTMNDLPTELLIEIFSYLRCEDLVLSTQYVNTRWRALSRSMEVWKYLKYIPGPNKKLWDIVNVLRRAPLLRTIVIEDNADVQTIVRTLCDYCIDVRNIEIWSTAPISPELIKKMFDQFPSIESFCMCLNTENEDTCIACLGKCHNLKRLALLGHGRGKWNNINLKPIADGCPQLMYLDLRYVYHADEDLIYLLTKKRLQLKSLLLNGNNITSRTFCLLPECKYLESFTLIVRKSRWLTDKELEAIGSLPQLKSLCLRGLENVPYGVIINFFRRKVYSSLIELDLSYYSELCEELAITIQSCCPNIRQLSLNSCFERDILGLEEMLKFQNLESLELCWCTSFSEQCITQLLRCNKLKYLNLRGSEKLNDTQVSELVTHLKFQYLNLSFCSSLTNNVLQDIPKCTTLNTLVLDCCVFTGECLLQMLSQMSLSIISVKNCQNIKPESVCSIEKLVMKMYV